MIRVTDTRATQAAVLALKAADRDLRKRINTATRQTMSPVWRSLVEQNAGTRLESRVIARGARIAAGNPPTAIAASSARALSGGLVPAHQWAAVELGMAPRTRTYTRTSPKGRSHSVSRRIGTAFRARRTSGYVALPAFAEIGPRMVSLWVQLIVKTYHDAAEKGAS